MVSIRKIIPVTIFKYFVSSQWLRIESEAENWFVEFDVTGTFRFESGINDPFYSIIPSVRFNYDTVIQVEKEW